MDTMTQEIYEAIIDGDMERVKDGVNAALSGGKAPGVILSEGMIAAMAEVGKRFEKGDFFVPEMLVSARAMKNGLEILRPMLAKSGVQAVGKVAIGTVKGDLHDIGKNLVAMMLEGAGFEINDLGVDVSPEKFVEVVKDNKPNIVALSALLTTTMQNMKATIEAIEAAGLRNEVKIMIGGAPVTQEYANQIGADGYSSDASRAVSVAKSLMVK